LVAQRLFFDLCATLPVRNDAAGTRCMPRCRPLVLTLVIAITLVCSATAFSQTYPARSIRLFVGLPPGGTSDILTRLVANGLETRLGQPVVVENRPGSGGNIAADLVAKAAPDGYTLMVAPDSLITINPHLYRDMPLDPRKDLIAISPLIHNQFAIVVSPKLAVKDLADFIALAKRTDPPLLYSSFGIGTQSHFVIEMLKQQANIDLAHVPYRGGVPAAMAVAAGDVSVTSGNGGLYPMFQSGQLRALGISSRERNVQWPGVPSISEFLPGYELISWQGLFAPAGTPQAVMDRLRAAVADAVKQKEFIERLSSTGSGEPYVATPDEFAAQIASDYDRYGTLVKSIGIKME
jgi:tripartite-type tricarboxylate transporter receptor subunit TctC